jgi:YfiH family protein
MPVQPFSLLRPFKKKLDVALFTKEDGDVTDESVRSAMNGSGVAALHQMHGSRAVVAREGIARTVDADALATDVPGLVLTIRTADCQPILVYAPEHAITGLIHAGWKGLLAGVIPSFFDLLWEEWQIRPEDTVVAVGPSLCQSCTPFTDPIKELPGIDRRFFNGTLVDLRGIAEDQLWKLGVREERFQRHPDCTRCDNRTYWSYRGTDREAVKKGKVNFLATALRPQ